MQLPATLCQDEGAAWKLLSDAAAHEHRDAQVLLGNLHLNKSPPDAVGAVQWYEIAADNPDSPHPDALFNLGQLYYNGAIPPGARPCLARPCSRRQRDRVRWLSILPRVLYR